MSPGAVTPARRSRDDTEDDEQDFDVSVDGESPAPSRQSKRARTEEQSSDEESTDEDDSERENTEPPLLPDSFRRSPKGNGRAANDDAASGAPKTHQPGSIVRVTLTDFVTYTKAEFNPGPNLNMVIGPNGTGKSTLVCALCIGLGWPTRHLGRGKDLGEFVKHGAKRGEIEIELAADPARHESNPVITTRIKQDDKGNAEYLINGKKENNKRVRELARSFSIQVDNLCQFLPQDRVVEFAGLSPVELLAQTQRAAAPEYMTNWHDQLKDWRKTQKTRQGEQQHLAEYIKSQQKRQDAQQPDVERLIEREALMERKGVLEKMKPFTEYHAAKEAYAEGSKRRKQAQKELSQLERRMEPNLLAVNEKAEYAARVDKATTSRRNLVTRTEGAAGEHKKKIETAQAKLQECDNDIEAEKKSLRAEKQSIPALRRNLHQIQQAMSNPPAAFDPAQMNEQIREKTRQTRNVNDKIGLLRDDVGSLGEQIRQRERLIESAEREKGQLQSQVGQQANKLRNFSRDTATAWEWIQSNRERLSSDVYGPPLVECNLKDRKHAAAVESMMQLSDLLAITVTSRDDFRMLTNQLYKSMHLHDLHLRVITQPVSQFRAPMSTEQLQRYGLEQWMLELIEGPDPVLAMLCDNRSMHQTAFTTREPSSSQFEALRNSSIGSWVTPNSSNFITRRREYGDKATSARSNPLKPARYFTDAPVDQQRERDIDRRIDEAQSEIDELKQSKKDKQTEHQPLKDELEALRVAEDNLKKEKAEKQTALSQFNALPTKRDGAERKLQDAQNKVNGSAERRRAINQRGDAISLEKGQHAVDYAHSLETLRGLHVQLFEAEILQIEAKSDLDQLKSQHEGERRLLQERKSEVEKLVAEVQKLLEAGKKLKAQCEAASNDFSDSEQELYEQIQSWSTEQILTEIASAEARLESLEGSGNSNTRREFEQRKVEIEQKTTRFNELGAMLEGLESQIEDIKKRWEPELDQLVAQISEAFADNFSKIQCAGEVGVHKDEDFEQWTIQIRVKFRENEPLSLLDSHRQSGGERAVSTIFYLMALQSLAQAPFRVVDEINQGMDPRNERLVHSRMVDIACAEAVNGRQGSQYFLITPKLLQGLRYHRDMKVHCIASGEHMPDDHSTVDFARAAKRALEIRGVGRTGLAMG